MCILHCQDSIDVTADSLLQFQDTGVTGASLQSQSQPGVLDVSYCAFSGLVPGFLFPTRGDGRRAGPQLVLAMGNAFACPLPPGVTMDDNMTCTAAAPAPGAAPAAAPVQAAAAPGRMTVAPVQKATLAAAAPSGAHATTELQSAAAQLADRCGLACMDHDLCVCLGQKERPASGPQTAVKVPLAAAAPAGIRDEQAAAPCCCTAG